MQNKTKVDKPFRNKSRFAYLCTFLQYADHLADKFNYFIEDDLIDEVFRPCSRRSWRNCHLVDDFVYFVVEVVYL